MEFRCVACSRRDVCDHVEWTMDEEGARLVGGVEDCPDFDLDPSCLSEFLSMAVLDLDPESYLSVDVGMQMLGQMPVYDIYIVMQELESKEDMDARSADIAEMAQEIADDIGFDFEWDITFIRFGSVTETQQELLEQWECPICGVVKDHKPSMCDCGYQPLEFEA